MASGRILLRLSEKLHLSLQRQAEARGVSVNELCCQRLILASPLENLPGEVARAVEIALQIGGANLIGIAVFGSWAKGAQHDMSDVDLLFVLDGNVTVSRRLYTQWQELAGQLQVCEPHFVKMPSKKDSISGFWAEIAVEGIVLYDSNQRLRLYLNDLRRSLIEGRLVSKKIHGQTYWIRNEVA